MRFVKGQSGNPAGRPRIPRTEEYLATLRQRKSEKNRRQYAQNAERRRAYFADWRRANKGRVMANSAKYDASKSQRTPGWADLEAIRHVYEVAAAWRLAGVDAHVDHVIPLRGRRVSGLHVPGNLTVMPGEENRRKRNGYEVD